MEDFREITSLLESITAVSGDRNNATTDDPLCGDASEVDGAAPMYGGYMVTVIGEDGTATVYRLDGLSLVNQTTNERFLMDADTSLLLNNALGIPQD